MSDRDHERHSTFHVKSCKCCWFNLCRVRLFPHFHLLHTVARICMFFCGPVWGHACSAVERKRKNDKNCHEKKHWALELKCVVKLIAVTHQLRLWNLWRSLNGLDIAPRASTRMACCARILCSWFGNWSSSTGVTLESGNPWLKIVEGATERKRAGRCLRDNILDEFGVSFLFASPTSRAYV